MRRFARLALDAGTILCVLGLGKAHAAAHGYDLTESARFAWSLGYAAALIVAAYGFGLPDTPRTLRRAFTAALGAAATAALAVSVVQLILGDALLPRAVVFGSAAVLVPWWVLCTRLTGDARRSRGGPRPRAPRR